MTKKINIYDDLANQPNEKLQELKKLFPNFFDIDGNLIIEEMQNFCKNYQEKPDLERFTFNWAGKNKAKEIAYENYIDGTLKFDRTRSKNFEKTENLIIEGDNLQVLKLLKNSYKSKVKCIYIDPPYNTGNDFVYNDKFELNIRQYLIDTGEIDEETGEKLADFIEKTDGKKHSKWLSFMFPRLMMARDLLTDDGVIFISIDDKEVAHLKLLMNEVFGEDNFIVEAPTIMNLKGNNDQYAFSGTHEYTVVYSKNKEISKFHEFNICLDEANWKEDKKGFYKKGSGLLATSEGKYREDRPYMYFPLLIINNNISLINIEEYHKIYDKKNNVFNDIFLNALRIKYEKQGYCFLLPHNKNSEKLRWTWGYNGKFKTDLDEIIITNIKNSFSLNKKQRPSIGDLPTKKPKSVFYKPEYSSGNGTNLLKEIFKGKVFDNPKPLQLVKDFIIIGTEGNDLILDFFAGSGTTGQAVMELNQEEIDEQEKQGLFKDENKKIGGRKFILVQLPEEIDKKKEAYKAGYKNISDITIERVKRAGDKYKNVDNGFKVLQLTDNPDKKQFWDLGNINDNEFVFTHIALFYGYGLNYKIEKISQKKEIYIMKAEFDKTKDAIIILEQIELTMNDVLDLINQYSNNKYKFFANDKALNIELTYNILQHFKEDNIIVF